MAVRISGPRGDEPQYQRSDQGVEQRHQHHDRHAGQEAIGGDDRIRTGE